MRAAERLSPAEKSRIVLSALSDGTARRPARQAVQTVEGAMLNARFAVGCRPFRTHASFERLVRALESLHATGRL